MLPTTWKYEACAHIQEHPPDTSIDPDILNTFAADAKVLPLFEKRAYEYTRMRHYSLQTNAALRCAWEEYLRRIEGRQRMPFQFPKPDDFHFYKNQTLYVPSQSLVNRDQLKMITFGKGGEIRGYAPVAVDMHTRRTAVNVRKPREKPPRKIWKRKVMW